MSAFSLLIGLAAMACSLRGEDQLRPTFASEVAAPQASVVLPLLRAICGEGVRTVDAEGKDAVGCGDGSMDEILASRERPRRYQWMPYTLWEADGVIFGHFLSPTSEDVAINCFGCEGHPDLNGGTLFLTKRLGRWQPVWYKPGVITRHCRRVALDSGRQILLCEETDGGMGHRVHGLYTIDFLKPKFAWHSVVLMADTFGSSMFGMVQKQFIDRVVFEEGGQGVRVYARHGSVPLKRQYAEADLPQPRVASYEIDFQVVGEGFKVTAATAAAGRLFGVK